MGFQGGIVVKNQPANAGNTGDLGSIPGLGRSSDRKWQPTPVFLPGKSHRQRAWRVQSMGLQRFGHTHTRVDMNFIKILENLSNCKNLLKNIVEWT